ncbi:presenilins-associated rhomboid-like protein, mitochondrial [Trichogramma pretiosum]|uniref:presenilins-associated rhomboid-like protein, mitochondrial n=1 Tax=Trichogramma pretiosum TaxID=7493 RepID=UPI0006C9802C|nr:presenilins-associated rhomboid-like protein, mitochondrial [Trichogramma pretiosum]
MATRMLLQLGVASNKCVFSSSLQKSKLQLQNVIKHNFRKVRDNNDLVQTQSFLGSGSTEMLWSGPSAGNKLLRAFVFASGFTGASFVGATIWEYERIRDRTYKTLNPFGYRFRSSVTGWRSNAKEWWMNLTEGQRMFWFICYANALVFVAWKIPSIRPTMLKYFATNPVSNVTCLPMVLSMFSHFNLWHLAANMYVLHSFSTAAVGYLGKEQFLAVYLSSGVMSSFVSNAYKILLNRHGFSLGASGAIMGILAFICTQFPDTKLSIIMLPQFTFSAGSAIKAIMAFDTAGCVMGWQFFDHAAHLGGALFGIIWQFWGLEHVWRKRGPLLQYWHEIRNPPK